MASDQALEAAGLLLLGGVAVHLLPGLLPVARLRHTLVHTAASRALLSASWAPTTRGFFHRIWASPIRLQASLILDGRLS